MDMHPAGVPRLVGPEGWQGWQFPQSDFSSQFRFLPNNITNEITPPHLETLPTRSHLQPLHLQSSPSSPRFSGAQPLRLRDEHPKVGSPRPSPTLQHLLSPNTNSRAPLPNAPPTEHKRPPHAISPPGLITEEEMEEADLLMVAANGNEDDLLVTHD